MVMGPERWLCRNLTRGLRLPWRLTGPGACQAETCEPNLTGNKFSRGRARTKKLAEHAICIGPFFLNPANGAMRPPRKLDNFKRPLHRLFGRIGREYFFARTLTARQPLTLGLGSASRRAANWRTPPGCQKAVLSGFAGSGAAASASWTGSGSVSPLMGASAAAYPARQL